MDTERIGGNVALFVALMALGILLAISSPIPVRAAGELGPLEVPANQRAYLLCDLSHSRLSLEVSANQRSHLLARSWLAGALEVPARQRAFLQRSAVALAWEVPPLQRMYLLPRAQLAALPQ